jgi:hypothetical protein
MGEKANLVYWSILIGVRIPSSLLSPWGKAAFSVGASSPPIEKISMLVSDVHGPLPRILSCKERDPKIIC